MSTTSDIKENLVNQVIELETLQSVYPEELSVYDHGNLADINDYISGSRTDLPKRLEYNVNLPTPKGTIEFLVDLPLNYPHINPEIYCRSSSLDRNEQMNLNKALSAFSESQEKGEPIVYSLILWLQDNADIYLENSSTNGNSEKKSDNITDRRNQHFGRYWIYSHHIYSKVKRRNIVDIARDCSLTGFSFVGKPGIICVEGVFDDCEYFWQQVKSWNWHRILVKFIEKDFDLSDNLSIYRKFRDFQEICFQNSEQNKSHNDTGQLLKYLKDHDVEHAFKELFGLEGKIAQPE